MTLRSILSQSALMLAIFLPLSACSLLPTQENDEERIRLEKADELFTTAGTLYDKGDYNGAYNYARKAFEYDESIQSEMLMAWSLVNLKRFDDFTIPNTNVPAKGARSLFANIIKDSPNEFRALLGVSTIEFFEHYGHSAKVEIFRSIQRRLRTFIDKLPHIPEDTIKVRENPTALEFIREWERVGGFAEGYRSTSLPEAGLLVDEQRPSAKVSGDKYPGWTAESLTLDTVPFLVKNGKVITARAKLAELMLYTSERADYWEKRSLEKVRGALEGFLELESRRQGQYHYILRDIGLAHVAIGNFYLQNEIDRAREVVKKQDWWYRVPETRQDEALLSFLQDEVRFPSSVRAAMNREFSEGTRWLSEFVEEDLVAERTRNDRVNERIFAASEAGEVDAIDQENLDLHKRAVAIFQAEQASLRKRIILQVLTLMIYPQFGMERLEEALVMVNRLEVTDPQDPITFLIRGVIYQRKREFENAMREFDLFISKSSVATDGPRITFARRERIACELEVEAALRKKD